MEKVTKFDLENAFKALDEINYSNRQTLKESHVRRRDESKSNKTPTELLLEGYYDVNSGEDLAHAKEARDDEIAKAKLAKIEKIVDLDAESPEDLEPSYAGKTIIQCPQCMTMFYKDQTDVNVSEEDPSICNVGEKCQHCGNDSGYTLVGKVAPIEPAEAANFEGGEESAESEDADLNAVPEEAAEEGTAEEVSTEEESVEETPAEDTEEKSAEEASEEKESEEKEEKKEEKEEKKEESFRPADFNTLLQEAKEPEDELKGADNAIVDCKVNKVISHCEDEKPVDCLGEKKPLQKPLTEGSDADLDKKLQEHNDYIKYLQDCIKQEEDSLSKAGSNEFVKASIQKKIDDLKQEFDDAIPSQVKASSETEELPTPEEAAEEAPVEEAAPKKESLHESAVADILREFENTLNSTFDESCESEACDEESDKLNESLPAGIIRAGDDCVAKLNAINDKYNKLAAQDGGIEEGLTEAKDDAKADMSDFEVKDISWSAVGDMFRDPTFKKFDEDLKEGLNESIPQSVIRAGDDCVAKLNAINDKYNKLAAQDGNVDENLEEGIFDKVKNIARGIGVSDKSTADKLKIFNTFVVRVSPADDSLDYNTKAKDINGAEIADKSFNNYKDASEYIKKITAKGPGIPGIKSKSGYKAYLRVSTQPGKSFEDCIRPALLFKNGVITDKSREKLQTLIANASKQSAISGKPANKEEDNPNDENDENSDNKVAEPKNVEKQSEPKVEPKAEPKQKNPQKKIVLLNAENGVLDVKKGDIAQGQDGKLHVVTADDQNYKTVANGKAVRNATKSAKAIMKGLGLLENLEGVEEIDEDSFGECVEKELKELYSNVDSFKCEDCRIEDDKMIVEGIIGFKSGKSRKTSYIFESATKGENGIGLYGHNEGLCKNHTMSVRCQAGKRLIAESFGYHCKINGQTREGKKSLKD